jgi:hypothetical protein
MNEVIVFSSKPPIIPPYKGGRNEYPMTNVETQYFASCEAGVSIYNVFPKRALGTRNGDEK